MYRGFEINIGEAFFNETLEPVYRKRQDGSIVRINLFESSYQTGKASYNALKRDVWSSLDEFIREDGVIDGGRLQEDWFAPIEADVFLSHSHADEKLAIAFANWLKSEFGIRTFIDSTVWGYAPELQLALDNRYAKMPSGSYYYNTSNRVCTFVNLLLSSALAKMMDSCECLMFLNTPNSIEIGEVTKETSSPWIYHELLQSSLLRTSPLKRRKLLSEGGRLEIVDSVDTIEKAFKVALPADTNHLTKLSPAYLRFWQEQCKKNKFNKNAQNSLDLLYHISKKNATRP